MANEIIGTTKRGGKCKNDRFLLAQISINYTEK
jgi:hypothetical protein